MEEHLVSVAAFMNEMEAEVAQATLAAAGIHSLLKCDDAGGMMPNFQQSEGVKLLVEEHDVEEAKVLLSTPADEQFDQ
jgi:hypothetical protein